MKIIKYITFILSLLVMAGHDVVPHLHDDEHAMAEHSAAVPHSLNNGLTDLQNAFSHFQHSADGKHLVYLGAVEKKVSPQINKFYSQSFFSVSAYSFGRHSHFKKRPFWEHIAISSSYISSSFFLRGPPSC
ncbi:MAG: hypothetical protein B7Y11_01495 [Sphingobacteriia bacterium 24-36-13]|nr:MAG: hypothetical protein B7Y11_01495 [Sphingobacteriia bacterium 24-36-13]OZA66282.1 MAG: hypothetical protein B7X68_00980 [Sphingobacteriia bacterium 39-36-14]